MTHFTTSSFHSLVDLAAKKAARALSFDVIENAYQHLHAGQHLPESIVVPLIRHCFPDSDEDIRLYSCLANGNANRYSEGEHLFKSGAVTEVFQIGYHISAKVVSTLAQN